MLWIDLQGAGILNRQEWSILNTKDKEKERKEKIIYCQEQFLQVWGMRLHPYGMQHKCSEIFVLISLSAWLLPRLPLAQLWNQEWMLSLFSPLFPAAEFSSGQWWGVGEGGDQWQHSNPGFQIYAKAVVPGRAQFRELTAWPTQLKGGCKHSLTPSNRFTHGNSVYI